jgi:hypothetical protein
MHWRRFRIDSIPLDNPSAFDRWLGNRWVEKDMLLGIYYRTGRFPADKGVDRGADGKVRRGAGYIETEVKSVRWYEFLQIFAPVGLFALVLYMFYGAIPKEVVSSADKLLCGNTINTLETTVINRSRTAASSPAKNSTNKSKVNNSAVMTQKTATKGGMPGPLAAKAKAQKTTQKGTMLERLAGKANNKKIAPKGGMPEPIIGKANNKKIAPKGGMPGPIVGKAKNDKSTVDPRMMKRQAAQTTAQDTRSGGSKSSSSAHNKANDKNQPMKKLSGSATAEAIHKVDPKSIRPGHKPKLNPRQLGTRLGGDSAPKVLRSKT